MAAAPSGAPAARRAAERPLDVDLAEVCWGPVEVGRGVVGGSGVGEAGGSAEPSAATAAAAAAEEARVEEAVVGGAPARRSQRPLITHLEGVPVVEDVHVLRLTRTVSGRPFGDFVRVRTPFFTLAVPCLKFVMIPPRPSGSREL